MKLNIFSANRRVISDAECVEATLPTIEGEVQILPEHADMLAMLETGRFLFRLEDGKKLTGVISSGFYKVDQGVLTVLAETLEFPNEIDIKRAKDAQALSEKELQSPDYDEAKFKKYELKLQRALIRQQIASE